MRQFVLEGRVTRLVPGFKSLVILEGRAGRALEPRETLTFMSNGEREEAIDVRAKALQREGWEEVRVGARTKSGVKRT